MIKWRGWKDRLRIWWKNSLKKYDDKMVDCETDIVKLIDQIKPEMVCEEMMKIEMMMMRWYIMIGWLIVHVWSYPIEMIVNEMVKFSSISSLISLSTISSSHLIISSSTIISSLFSISHWRHPIIKYFHHFFQPTTISHLMKIQMRRW